MRKLILITGAPRNGTTPIGTGMVTARGAVEIYEPLNENTGVPRRGGEYLFPGDELAVTDVMKRLTTGHFRLMWPKLRNHRRSLLFGRTARSAFRLRLSHSNATVIWKDPFACFTAEEVARAGVPVFVPFRPPVAVAASYARLGWDPRNLTTFTQRAASEGLAPPLDPMMINAADTNTKRAALVWHTVYASILQMLDRGAPIHLISMKDVATQPREMYTAILSKAGLSPTEETERLIIDAEDNFDGPSRSDNTRKVHRTGVSASDVISGAKDALSSEEQGFCQQLNGQLFDSLCSHPALIGALSPPHANLS